MNKQQKEVYVTKYLFTKGIQKRVIWDHGSFFNDVDDNWKAYRPNECHDTWEAAAVCAEYMRTKKIESLEKQIDKVRAMQFKQEDSV